MVVLLKRLNRKETASLQLAKHCKKKLTPLSPLLKERGNPKGGVSLIDCVVGYKKYILSPQRGNAPMVPLAFSCKVVVYSTHPSLQVSVKME
jgi:hypothetical protein